MHDYQGNENLPSSSVIDGDQEMPKMPSQPETITISPTLLQADFDFFLRQDMLDDNIPIEQDTSFERMANVCSDETVQDSVLPTMTLEDSPMSSEPFSSDPLNSDLFNPEMTFAMDTTEYDSPELALEENDPALPWMDLDFEPHVRFLYEIVSDSSVVLSHQKQQVGSDASPDNHDEMLGLASQSIRKSSVRRINEMKAIFENFSMEPSEADDEPGQTPPTLSDQFSEHMPNFPVQTDADGRPSTDAISFKSTRVRPEHIFFLSLPYLEKFRMDLEHCDHESDFRRSLFRLLLFVFALLWYAINKP